jgi:hypothetical protein
MALYGMSRVWGGLVANRSRPIRTTACDRIDAIAHSLPATLRSGACLGLLPLLGDLELSAIPKHGVHDREGDTRLPHG